MGRIHVARPLQIKTRRELLATIKPQMRKFLARRRAGPAGRLDAGAPSAPRRVISLTPAPGGV